ncbi:MAG: hypothetical protein IPK13_25345 [Deltaproteobacteria bacterium]|nr:hypothetical protein [Deltaproteobacteria bacterium]
MREQARGVSRELRRIAGPDDRISRSEAETASPEIRARLRTMFPASVGDGSTPTPAPDATEPVVPAPGPCPTPPPAPTRSERDDAVGTFLSAFDDRTSYAFEPGVASEEARAALPAFRDAVRELFAGLDVTAHTAVNDSPYWQTTTNVLLGRDSDNRYTALFHSSASES